MNLIYANSRFSFIETAVESSVNLWAVFNILRERKAI